MSHNAQSSTGLDGSSDKPDSFVLAADHLECSRPEFIRWLIELQGAAKTSAAVDLDETGQPVSAFTQALIDLLYQKFRHSVSPSVR
jgi:hypothetical protein